MASFPTGTRFVYLAEGAANIVYRILPPYAGMLLRVRKDLPTTVPCAIAQEDWLKYIKPLFTEDQIIAQCLVALRPGNVVSRLNDELQRWELSHWVDSPLSKSKPPQDPRPDKRHGTFLAYDEYGLLVTDMTPRGPEELIVEFKPKWLCQSPSAPKGSKRCRQCARTAHANAQKVCAGERLQETFCPLDLISKDPNDLLNVARLIVSPSGRESSLSEKSNVSRFATWLDKNLLLERLRQYQSWFDEEGPLVSNVLDINFLTSMTLRDCTVFVRFSNDESKKVEARIGDLDLKSPEKKESWIAMETTLINEGWYEGLEDEAIQQPLTCKLRRESHSASEAQGRRTQ